MTAMILAGGAAFARAAADGTWFDRGIPVVAGDKYGLSIWGRGQMLGVGQVLPDPYADHQRIYLFMKQARMGFNGHYEDLFKYQIEIAYGGENQNTLQSMAGGLDLQDFVADIPVRRLGEDTVFKIGQFRVPYGREALADEGYVNFADRSIANFGANQGRDYGLAILGRSGNFTGTIGTFPGGGRDIAQRYLPERFGFPEIVARFGYNDGVDEDIYHVMGTDRNLKRTTKALMFNGLYTMDTRIGHSTALMSHSLDNNLLVDKNYNPYLAHGDPQNQGAVTAICSANSCQRGHLYFVGSDAVLRHPLGNGQAVEVEAEGNWGGYWNRYGTLHMATGRAQADYQIGNWTIGARYAVMEMGNNAGYLTATAPTNPATQFNTLGAAQGYAAPNTFEVNGRMGKPIHEITPGIAYHIKGHHLKIVADLPIYIDAPMFVDHLDGSYAMVDPTGTDQVAVGQSAGNGNLRRTYYEGRMLFQFQF
jgi:hypothetical protein